MNLDITYRGSLASCNYACDYCPFAKRRDSHAALKRDKQALDNFIDWVETRQHHDTIKILFTPWGEALVRGWYREGIIRLSHMPHVSKVVVQTNLSAKLSWLQRANKASVALWTTYHPSEASLESFFAQSAELKSMGVMHSVGLVGKKEYLSIAEQLRAGLAPSIYLWINAYKDEKDYYEQSTIDAFTQIDPLFSKNLCNYVSLGQACHAGETSVSIKADGSVYRCHFVDQVLGNIYQRDIHQLLGASLCPESTCGCYIGYRHLKKLNLTAVYGEKIIERIPVDFH